MKSAIVVRSGAKVLRAEIYFEHNNCVLRSNHRVGEAKRYPVGWF